MELKKFYQNMYMICGVDAMPSPENKDFMSNAYGILTNEGWIVIDLVKIKKSLHVCKILINRDKIRFL
jgi:hypothetical protein